MAAILQNAETIQTLLTESKPDLDEVRAAIADIIDDDARAGEVIQRLRSLFRRDDPRKTSLDLGKALGEIARIVQSDAVIRNVAFSVDVAGVQVTVMADRVQLQQAVINLVLNAFDAVAGLDQRLREVSLNVIAGDGGWARILVRDSGNGINPEITAQIFDAFFTTKPSGMGMGLAISRSIVEAHGGRLAALPNPDRGMTFEILLPTSSANTH